MKKLGLVPIVLGVFAFGCANQTPLAPAAAAGGAGELSAKPSAAPPGIYTADLHGPRGRNAAGSDEPSSADRRTDPESLRDEQHRKCGQAGTVTFEYCSYKGGPPNDISRADEAPKEACEQGTASWARLTSLSVYPGMCPPLGPGYACMNFGIVRIPRQIGFRFRYAPQGSGIAGGSSEEKNFTWTEGS